MIANKRKFLKAARRFPSNRKTINDWVVKKLDKLKVTQKSRFDAMNKYFPAYEKPSEEIAHMTKVDMKTVTQEIQLHPSVAELLLAIQNDPTIYMCFHNMYMQQADHSPPGGIYVRTWQETILLINECIHEAPEFDEDPLIPVPLNAILNLPMATPAGNF